MWDWISNAVYVVFSFFTGARQPEAQKPASLTEFDAPIAKDGKEIAVIFGTVWVKGANVVWYGDLASKPIRQKGGKK